jgi:hypothetical protein
MFYVDVYGSVLVDCPCVWTWGFWDKIFNVIFDSVSGRWNKSKRNELQSLETSWQPLFTFYVGTTNKKVEIPLEN